MNENNTYAKLVSPCISICQMDAESGVCLGCYRTRKEIGNWSAMTPDEQHVLLDDLRDRRAAATGARRRRNRRRSLA